MFTTQDLVEAGQKLRELEKERDILQGKIDGARAVLRRITRATQKRGFTPEISRPVTTVTHSKPHNINLKDWTADQIIAANLKRAGEGLPPIWGSEEALEDLAKAPPSD